MGNQNNQEKKWSKIFFKSRFVGLSVSMSAVFGKDAEVEVDRLPYIDPHTKIKKLPLKEIRNSDACVVLEKLFGHNPEYHEIGLKFLVGTVLARESEDGLFQLRNPEYCFLRVQAGVSFKPVFIRIDNKWNYKVSVVEEADTIRVILLNNPMNIPRCFSGK